MFDGSSMKLTSFIKTQTKGPFGANLSNEIKIVMTRKQLRAIKGLV